MRSPITRQDTRFYNTRTRVNYPPVAQGNDAGSALFCESNRLPVAQSMPLTRQFIGKRLRNIRQLRELTQLELAKAIGVGKEVVCRTERGDREMAYHEAVAYAQVLCFCLNAFWRTEAEGSWDITACLLPYVPPKAAEALTS